MRYRDLTGDSISLLGYGGMRFPTVDGHIDVERAKEMVLYAYDRGVNYFDTAYMYHNGESESFFGYALEGLPRDSYYVADKMPVWMCETEADVERIFTEQLAKVKVDYFDYYLLHSVTWENYEIAKRFGAIDKLLSFKQKGYIKKLGFSFHGDMKLLKEFLDMGVFEFVQLQLNYYDWEIYGAREMYEEVTSRGLPVIVMEPVRGGALARLNDGAREILRSMDETVSTAGWAIRFVASLPNVACVLSGMSDLAMTEDNIRNVDMEPLTDGEIEGVMRALETFRSSEMIPCTGCKYCMECTVGIDIPGCFSAFNDYAMNPAKEHFGKIFSERYKAECIECMACTKKCPQAIDIPTQLMRAKKKFE